MTSVCCQVSTEIVFTLAKGKFVEKKENLIFLGNSGIGKTNLTIALGMEMIYKTKFNTASELVEELLIAKEEHRLGVFEKNGSN